MELSRIGTGLKSETYLIEITVPVTSIGHGAAADPVQIQFIDIAIRYELRYVVGLGHRLLEYISQALFLSADESSNCWFFLGSGAIGYAHEIKQNSSHGLLAQMALQDVEGSLWIHGQTF